MITININGTSIAAETNDTIIKAARRAEIYIPGLCYDPDLPPRKGSKPVESVYQGNARIEHDSSQTPEGVLETGCGLCVVEMGDTGELIPACLTTVAEGMKILTNTEKVAARRQEKLVEILANHPHACLTCAQQEGCPKTQCSSNVPLNERCCPLLGNCELQKVADFIGISPAAPKWVPTDLPLLEADPLFARNYNLCIGCTRCVRACRDLRGINAIGFVVDNKGKVRVGSVAPDLKDSGCKFCTACVEVCPTGAIMDKGVTAQKREEQLLPCVVACPAGINIPWYVRLVAEGQADAALAVIREKVPFPGILGRVCVRPCEEACRRGEVNEPISICALKRFASDNGSDSWKAAGLKAPDTGKKVAVVGAGPAGLTAAFYLRKRGHAVTVFDSNDQRGGMMRYGIPDYRLPEAVLDKEIEYIADLGVQFRPSTLIGEDMTLGGLRSDFDAVFIGSGAPLSRKLNIDGSQLPQVLWGIDFLREAKLSKGVSLSGKVVVIGGGAVAVDVALTARRLGAEEVHMVCLEDRHEMPARDWEIRDAEDEGVFIHNCWGPLEVVEQEGGIKGTCFSQCVCVFDSEGAFNPSFDGECTMGLAADTVIMAIGQSTDLEFASQEGVAIQRNLIKVDEKSLQTSIPGVFAGGDAVVLPGAIIHAVAAGRKAASAIDKYLGGNGEIDETLYELPKLNCALGRDEGFAYLSRVATRKIPLSERTEFQAVDLGFGDDGATAEAKRCLQCDLRLALSQIVLPPEHILPFTRENVEKVPETEGAFRLMDETKKVIVIKGTENMRAFLLEQFESNELAKFFDYEENKMYSKRESELVQQHLQKYGEMPGGAGDEEDLFE